MESKENEFISAFAKTLADQGINIIDSKDIKKTEIIGKGGYGKVSKISNIYLRKISSKTQ